MLCTLRFRPFPGSTFLSAPPLVGSLSARGVFSLRSEQTFEGFLYCRPWEKPFPALCPDFFQLIHAVIHLLVPSRFLCSLAEQTRADYLKGAADNSLLREVLC
jgi:hypothetical protein